MIPARAMTLRTITTTLCSTAAGLLVACFALSVASATAEQAPRARWVTAWSTSQQALGNMTMTNATVRLVARVTASGEAVRIRLDNSYGTAPLVVGAASLGERMTGSQLTPGSIRPVRFGGSPRVTVPLG